MHGESDANVRPSSAVTGGAVISAAEVLHAVRQDLLIRCPDCTAVLGATLADIVVARHKRRVYVGFILAIRCECGFTWKPDHVALSIERLEAMIR